MNIQADTLWKMITENKNVIAKVKEDNVIYIIPVDFSEYPEVNAMKNYGVITTDAELSQPSFMDANTFEYALALAEKIAENS